MADLLRTLLAPVLLVQGRRMFARMPKLPLPTDLGPGPRGDGPPLSLLVVGDSSAAGIGVERQEDALLGQLVERLSETHRVTWDLHARFGSTIPKTTAWLGRQPAHPVDLAVVAVGLNDILAGASLDSWTADFERLIAVLHGRFQAGHVIVSGLPPVGEFPALPHPMRFVVGRQRDRHDAALQALAAHTPGTSYVWTNAQDDTPLSEGVVRVAEVMSADGFHPGPRVYAEWARRAAEVWRKAA